jgi:hypothetical protein
MSARGMLTGSAVLGILVALGGCGVHKLALGPGGSATVWGTVLDHASGAPLAGASVWSSPASATTTDPAGRYSFLIQWDHGNPTIDEGQGCKVGLIVAKAGYASAHPEISCRNGTSYREDLALDPLR